VVRLEYSVPGEGIANRLYCKADIGSMRVARLRLRRSGLQRLSASIMSGVIFGISGGRSLCTFGLGRELH
jgi:hypothetical protein